MNAKEYQYGNAIIRIYRPDLSGKEQQRQERIIETALQYIGKEIKENQNGNSN